ncbi:MAG: hypothetical protein HKN32_09705 [Flavobacteriales bacterium]|nr:hypothetical protein [Flavobacteriales bacterium]
MRFLYPALTCLVTFLHVSAFTQSPPAELYGEGLRAWLKVNTYDPVFDDQGYNGIRIAMYSYIDEVGGQVECVYSGFQQPAAAVTFLNPINAEHIIPQSWFGSASPMRSDIFNLRPSHESANSSRSNYPFGEVDDASAQWYGVDAGNNYYSTTTEPANSADFSERQGSLWEPREDRKGDVARQVFYFYTMYPTQAGSISLAGDINTFYTWHINDPVDVNELVRNDRAEETQGNRNPYVDDENLVHLAWFFQPVSGCTYPLANNYNSAATVDDGTCDFTNSCPEDLSGDGVINTPDVLQIISTFGSSCQ